MLVFALTSNCAFISDCKFLLKSVTAVYNLQSFPAFFTKAIYYSNIFPSAFSEKNLEKVLKNFRYSIYGNCKTETALQQL